MTTPRGIETAPEFPRFSSMKRIHRLILIQVVALLVALSSACTDPPCEDTLTCPAAPEGGGGAGVHTGGESQGGEAGGGGAPQGCGDGTVDLPEECDEGSANGPGRSCKADCTLNVCGDGDQGPSEGCDDGSGNGMELGSCAPDCSRVVEKRIIALSAASVAGGDFGPNPVALADAQCEPGSKAMFAYGDQRRATIVPFEYVSPIDWPVEPYTYYYNAADQPVFMTDGVPLIGVRRGAFVGLENYVLDVVAPTASGVGLDYVTLQSNNCNGWSSSGASYTFSHGLPVQVDQEFLVRPPQGCDYGAVFFYCLEQ